MEENEEFDSDFNTEDIPISEEFWDYMENYWHNNREFPESTEVSLSKKADLINGKVPSSQLPSYVDDVLEFDTFENLPDSGEKGKIYLITNNNTQFRWSGSDYIQLNSDENFVTTNTDQRIDGKKSFVTAGGNGYNNHSLRLFSNDGSNPGLTFYKGGTDIANLYFDGNGNFKFRNSDDTVSRYVFAQGFKKDGSGSNKILLGDGTDRPVTDFHTATQADAKYIPFTGSPSNVNLNAKNLSNVGLFDATAFRNGTSSALVKSLSIGNTAVTSFGIKLTNPGTSNMMGSFTVTIFGYTGQTLSFRVSMYKYMYNWYVPTITWLHGDSAKISKIEFYKEDDSNLHLKVNFITNFGSYHKSVITDVLANTGDALHNPETYTLLINPDNSAHTLQVAVASANFVRDSNLPTNANHITTNTHQSGLTGDKTTIGNWIFGTLGINRTNLTDIKSFSLKTNNSLRWAFYINNESGSNNSGGDFTLSRYSDTGAYISNPLTIFRDSGAIRLSNLAGAGTRMIIANATGDLSTQAINFWEKHISGSYTGINASTPFAILNGNTAQHTYMGGLLISNVYSDATNIPANGAYIKGELKLGSNLNSANEITLQKNSVNRFRTIGNESLLSGGIATDGIVRLRPRGDTVTTGQVIMTGTDSQYDSNYNMLFGNQTANGANLFHTGSANTTQGYGLWMAHNLKISGTDFIQPRGSLGSYAFTVNYHKGFSFNTATASGTNDSIVTLTEVVKIDSTGMITTLNHGNSSLWKAAFPTNYNNSISSTTYQGSMLAMPVGSYSAGISASSTNIPFTTPGGLISFGQTGSVSTRILGARDNSDNLWFQSGDGTGAWRQLASQDWVSTQLASYITQSALNTQLGNYAKLNGIQTFSGTNTFSQNIEIPFATNANHAVNLGLMSDYVDSNTNDIMAYISQNFIGTSHIVNGVTSTNINNWNTVFGWGNHATAGYTTQSWINSQDYASTAFVEESINKICLEITDPDYPINAKNQFITVIITDNFSEEKINWEEFHPEQHISVINTGSKILDLNFQGQPFDKIEEKQTSEYYVNRDKKLIKKGTYKSAEILI